VRGRKHGNGQGGGGGGFLGKQYVEREFHVEEIV
jgi:hypothetical protein